MIIDCISDLHGYYPELSEGDLLIVAGDLTDSGKAYQFVEFFLWLDKQKYRKKIIISGNHDNILQITPPISESLPDNTSYLCDSGTEFKDEQPVRNLFDPNDKSLVYRKTLKIWGSPWTKRFPSMNPKCMAFTVDTDEELAEKWSMIPDDVDILITHCPPYCLMDQVYDPHKRLYLPVGSPSLRLTMERIKPKLHVWGHIHESHGQLIHKHEGSSTMCVNASHVTDCYEPINKPIRIIL